MASSSLVTRLRFISSRDPEALTAFVSRIGRRIQIYGAPQYHPKENLWYLWFVPGDGDKWTPDNVRLEDSE